MTAAVQFELFKMGEIRDRGVMASEVGAELLQKARASKRNEKDKSWTYANVATEASCDERTVRRFLKREQSIDESYARSICEALDVPFESALNCPDFEEADRNGQLGVNPFIYGAPVPPEKFYGRVGAIAHIKNRIGAVTAQSVNVVGMRRMGKSSLLRYIKARTTEFCLPEQQPLIVLLDLQDQRFHHPQGMTEGLRRQIRRLTGEEWWTESDNLDPYAVEDGLAALKEKGYRLIVMLDEFEAIGRRLEIFQDWGEDWRAKACAELFALVISSKRPISEVYNQFNLTSPFSNIFSTTVLGTLEPKSWHKLVRDGFANRSVSPKTLQWMDEISGGLPFYVQMAAACLWQYGDLRQAEREFRVQAQPRFCELWQNLEETERLALKSAGGEQGGLPIPSAVERKLQDFGLLRPDGRPFSPVFLELVQEQP